MSLNMKNLNSPKFTNDKYFILNKKHLGSALLEIESTLHAGTRESITRFSRPKI